MLPLLNSLYADCGLSSDEALTDWIAGRIREVTVSVDLIPFRRMRKWLVDPSSGNLIHESGRFFSVEGLEVKTDCGNVRVWHQPIVNQPETGILGIIAKETDGVMHLLMQAKIEPGNGNYVQISPTLQATKSNYNRIHRGKTPLYLEYFQKVRPENIMLDQLQSEQGARFLKKRNRNIIILTDDENIPLRDDFRWMTVAQVKRLMRTDNAVNMAARTVLSGIAWGELARSEFTGLAEVFPFFDSHHVSTSGRDLWMSSLATEGLHSTERILSWLSQLKFRHELHVKQIPLNALAEWHAGENEIARADRRFFRIVGAEIMIDNREVNSWCQPFVQPVQDGICAFIIKKIHGVYHFLVQAKLECGNFDVFELAPTVQYLADNSAENPYAPPFLDCVLQAEKKQILFDVMLSEEGGRFFREQNRNMMVIAGDDFDETPPETFIWMTLGQIHTFLKFGNYLNIQARSLISLIDFR